MTIHAFVEALVSSQGAPEISEADDLFGYLIGSWEIDAVLYGTNGEVEISRRVAIDAFRSGLASHAAYPSLAIDLPVSET